MLSTIQLSKATHNSITRHVNLCIFNSCLIGHVSFDRIMAMLLGNPNLVGTLTAFLLDNTVPGLFSYYLSRNCVPEHSTDQDIQNIFNICHAHYLLEYRLRSQVFVIKRIVLLFMHAIYCLLEFRLRSHVFGTVIKRIVLLFYARYLLFT